MVEIRGLDVYDPTTGEIRSSSTDDIACWFIDTNYNSESFFVRHAYFTGADEPYDRLKRALRAEIVEGGSKRRRRGIVAAVENGGAHWCIFGSREDRGVSRYLAQLRREAQECDPIWSFGKKFVGEC